MRRTILTGVAAIGFLAIGVGVLGHPGAVRQADAEGSGADIGMTRHHLVAMIDTSRSRPVLLAQAAPAAGIKDHPTVLASLEPPDPC